MDAGSSFFRRTSVSLKGYVDHRADDLGDVSDFYAIISHVVMYIAEKMFLS